MSPSEDYYEYTRPTEGCSSFVVDQGNTSVDDAMAQNKKNILPKIGGANSFASQQLNIKRIKNNKQSQSNLLGTNSLPTKSPGVISDKLST